MRRPHLRRGPRPPRRRATLTTRLVVTAVALVAVVTLLVGGVTALAMRTYLLDRLGNDVSAALVRAEQAGPGGPGGPGGSDDDDYPGSRTGSDTGMYRLNCASGGGGYGDVGVQGQSVGTLSSRYFKIASSSQAKAIGSVIGEDGSRTCLSTAVLSALASVPADGRVHQMDLPGLGSYRVAADVTTDRALLQNLSTGEQVAINGGRVVVGLPDGDVDDAVSTLVLWESLLIVLGVLVAGLVGRTVVRRQLRPLREVAATAHEVAGLPLASGEIGVTGRVDARLVDSRTEVGQVGAALNTLLEHVETSLDARFRSEQRVRQFVADASHELRTPLTTIAGYTQLARRRPDDAEATATALAKVEEESGRMTTLVEDLLLLARLDSGRPLDRAPVDLTRLMLEAVSDARVVAPEHRWRLELPEDAVEVDGDEQRLHQVVTNLLTNARKYTPAGTTVTVSARAGGFSVHDDGPGFPDGLADVAFERFARGDSARNRQGGVGLGLALVEAIVTAHGGTVRLTTEPGSTTIDVELVAADRTPVLV